MYQIYFSCLVLSFLSVCLLCLSKLQYGITHQHFENWSNLENLVHLAQIQIKSISVESSFSWSPNGRELFKFPWWCWWWRFDRHDEDEDDAGEDVDEDDAGEDVDEDDAESCSIMILVTGLSASSSSCYRWKYDGWVSRISHHRGPEDWDDHCHWPMSNSSPPPLPGW